MNRRYNLGKQDLIDSINRICKGNIPTCWYIRAAYVKNDGKWRHLISRVVLNSDLTEDTEAIYMEHAFVAKPLKNVSVSEFIDDITSDGYSISDILPPIKSESENTNWEEEIIPSHLTAAKYPVRKYSTNINRNANFSDSILVSYDMDFYMSSIDYLRDFIGLKDFHGNSDAKNGSISLEVTDYRGRINIEDNSLSITGPELPLCIVGQINNNEPINIKNGETLDIGKMDFKDIELWMVSEDNELLDYWSSSEWKYNYPVMDEELDERESFKNIINNGESEECEFKKYISITDKSNPKSYEIERTVCAFSNLRGGILFIGINDEAEVVGLGKNITRDYSCEIDQAIFSYEKEIRSRLKEHLKDNQCFRIKVVEIYSEHVITVTVSKSSNLNYLLNPKQTYIRRGATSAKMSPEEINAFSGKAKRWET